MFRNTPGLHPYGKWQGAVRDKLWAELWLPSPCLPRGLQPHRLPQPGWPTGLQWGSGCPGKERAPFAAQMQRSLTKAWNVKSSRIPMRDEPGKSEGNNFFPKSMAFPSSGGGVQEAPGPRKPSVSSFSAYYCPLVALSKIPAEFYLLFRLPFSPPLLLFFILFFYSLSLVCLTALPAWATSDWRC